MIHLVGDAQWALRMMHVRRVRRDLEAREREAFDHALQPLFVTDARTGATCPAHMPNGWYLVEDCDVRRAEGILETKAPSALSLVFNIFTAIGIVLFILGVMTGLLVRVSGV